MSARRRVSADGWIDVSDRRKVNTPGKYDPTLDPVPEAEALSFLLSHSFPGHRRVVRHLTTSHRKQIRRALWADSVAERMGYVDRVWRDISEPVLPPPNGKPVLLQVLRYGDAWAYPLYLDGNVTRVRPHGGIPAGELDVPAVSAGAALDLKSA